MKCHPGDQGRRQPVLDAPRKSCFPACSFSLNFFAAASRTLGTPCRQAASKGKRAYGFPYSGFQDIWIDNPSIGSEAYRRRGSQKSGRLALTWQFLFSALFSPRKNKMIRSPSAPPSPLSRISAHNNLPSTLEPLEPQRLRVAAQLDFVGSFNSEPDVPL